MATRSKILASIAALALACGAAVGIAGAGPAGAATAACGSKCTTIDSEVFGYLAVASVKGGTAQKGQAVIMSATGPYANEDFKLLSLGTVDTLYNAGIVGSAV